MPLKANRSSKTAVAPSCLLAKSPKGKRPRRSLVGHTCDVMEAFEALFGTSTWPTELAAAWARFFGLKDVAPFLLNGLVASWDHDWGKVDDGFQAMLTRTGKQLLRHEQISAVLMTWPSVWDWLACNRELDLPLILAAVVGHHLKARDVEFGQPQTEIDSLLRLRWDDAELQQHLATVAPRLGLAQPVPHRVPKIWSFDPRNGVADLGMALDRVRDQLELLGDALESDKPCLRLLWAVRAALIAADAAGSGLFRENKPISRWIGDAFDAKNRLDGDAVDEKVIAPRRKKIGRCWRGWNDFQEACSDAKRVPARALLLAPCGSGKTLAAWRWIAARCSERPRGRVIFLYPTRGTATEGFRDYVAEAGPEEASLVHGAAQFDLDGIYSDLDSEERINEARLFALGQWPKRLFSATVDQFLGFLQYGYGPMCHLPVLADSVVVFDEVHSYDRGMFSALLQFLENFDLPVLCMTATLLEKRRQKLEKHLAVFNGLEDSGGDLKTIADYPRYQVSIIANAEEAENQVKTALCDQKRVLWVVNTVDRAQEIARRFAADPAGATLCTPDGVAVFCYHSRYTLADRKTWHEQVVSAFRRGQPQQHGAVLALTTQVCELSLDLDADVLVTEFAPASSLVQRMGRCCRDPDAHSTGRVGLVILYPTDEAAPYTKQDMFGVMDFVAMLGREGNVSQSRLEELLAGVPQAAELPKECRFIFSGPWAAMGEENFRDIDDYTRQAVLDVDEYLEARESRKPWEAQGLILPVPKKFTDPEPHDKLPSWLRIAKGGRYRPALGYCDERPDPVIV
jgi:CRISPR-associated endonuclease/helicase Cas3